MHIVFYVYGTRGDIQPSLVLARELKDRGHQVLMVCGKRLKYLVDIFELKCDNIEDDGLDLLFSLDLQKKDLDTFLDVRANLYNEKPDILNQFIKSSEGYDLIIPSGLCIAEAMTVSEVLKIPYIPLLLQPSRTGEIVNSIFSKRPSFYFSFLNRLSHTLFIKAISKVEKRRVEIWRRNLGLKSLHENFFEILAQDPKMLNIHGYDKILFPKEQIPLDYQPGWKVVGFFYPQEIIVKQIPDKLSKFLNKYSHEIDGATPIEEMKCLPIVFGLGSIPALDKKRVTSILKYTIEKLGKDTKWIILNNWTNWEESFECDNVIQLDNVDHTWLFRYCSIAILHGGIGSCAAIMKSATPSIITSLLFDQPQNANRLKDLGISIPFDCFSLKQDDLVNSIKIIRDNYNYYKSRCLEISHKISNNSLMEAVKIIENYNEYIGDSNKYFIKK